VKLALATALAAEAGGTWATAPSLPTPRSAYAVAVAAGAVYVLGGPGNRNVDRFDGKRWVTVTKLPAERRHVCLRGVENRWSRGPRIPPRGTAGAPVLGNAIYVFGGESQPQNAVLGDVFRLRDGSRSWERPR
jgi:N-acetylneuraminic acid mutarotase